MANWMLSIPSKDCTVVPTEQNPIVCEGKEAAKPPGVTSYNLDQPYEEIPSDSPDYNRAVRDGEERVEAFNRSVTGQHCPADDDIVDPKVLNSPLVLGSEKKEYPAPQDPELGVPPNGPRVVKDIEAWAGLRDGVPDHAHWVTVDTTDNYSNRWIPRRTTWESVIAERSVPVSAELDRVIDQLQALQLSDDQKAFSQKLVPMGLWHPDCRHSELALSSPTVSELQVKALKRGSNQLDDLELWVLEGDQDDIPLQPQIPVHSQSRGEAVFRAICQNCHGRAADSRSPLATTIGELTGGETRVANFVDGILGPKQAPGQFAEDAFRINRGATPAEWQVRYMMFMGLGGTEAHIPSIAISLVSTSPFYGTAVRAGQSTGANMLQAASGKCDTLLHSLWEVDEQLRVHPKDGRFVFVKSTGEYELWESLCGYRNEPVVRVLLPSQEQDVLFTTTTPLLYRGQDNSGAWVYPTDHPVGNRLGKFQIGIQPNNYLPWCVRPTPQVSREQLVATFASKGVHESMMPICPDQLFATAFGGKEIYRIEGGTESFDNTLFMERVTRRGAINAGVAAYYYLDGITKGTFAPAVAFDSCEAQP
jgi:mono/diheme cytochrome c family protein